MPNIFGSSILTFSCEHSGSWNFEVVHRFLWIMCTAVLTLLIRSADCFIWRPSSYHAVNTFHLGYKNRSFYDISGTSRCLFSDKYKTHKYSVGRAYSCWMLNCWCITWPVGFKRLTFGDTVVTYLHGAESKNRVMVVCKLWFEKYLRWISHGSFSVQYRYLTEGTKESYGMPSVMITGA